MDLLEILDSSVNREGAPVLFCVLCWAYFYLISRFLFCMFFQGAIDRKEMDNFKARRNNKVSIKIRTKAWMRAIQFYAFPLKVNADNLGLPLHADEFRFCQVLYAASDINSARNDVCYRDFLALVLSPPFTSLDEEVAGDGAERERGLRKRGKSSRWRKPGICISEPYRSLTPPNR